MNDYSDLFFLLAALIIFSYLGRSASHMFFYLNNSLVESDIEYSAIALGQDIIDEVKWTNSVSELEMVRKKYDKKPFTVKYGVTNSYQIVFNINMHTNTTPLPGSSSNNRHVWLTITSDYLPSDSSIELEFIKSF